MTTSVCGYIMLQKARYVSLLLNILKASWRQRNRKWTASPIPQRLTICLQSDNMGKLTVMQADLFRTLVEKILFVRCRSRPNLQITLALLTLRVQNIDGNDHNKLARTINYIRATRGMELTLEEESMDTIRWWIDAEYGMHQDLKGHSGGMMSPGKCASASKLSRHSINSRSSTES